MKGPGLALGLEGAGPCDLQPRWAGAPQGWATLRPLAAVSRGCSLRQQLLFPLAYLVGLVWLRLAALCCLVLAAPCPWTSGVLKPWTLRCLSCRKFSLGAWRG